MELLSPVLILASQVINLALVVTDSHEQMRVGMLTGEEFVNDFLHIGQTCRGTDLLESLLDLLCPLHLLLHLLLEELAPHLLDHVVFLHF